jgi:REP element-mobilizing transposase RayT
MALRAELQAYLGGISKTLECPPTIVGGTDDHVHMLCRLGRTIAQANWVKEVKRVSSAWIKQHDPTLADFAWQTGYGAFSVSVSNLEKVQAYISNQEEHHRQQSFQDEYRAFLKKHGLECDERYMWD